MLSRMRAWLERLGGDGGILPKWRVAFRAPLRAWRWLGRGRYVLGGFLGFGLATLIAFGPVARGRIAREAERRGVIVTIGHVRPGFFAVVLEDVRASPEGVPDVAASLGTIRVSLSAGLSVREVVLTSGSVTLHGEREKTMASLEAWKARHAQRDNTVATSHGQVKLRGEALSLKWEDGNRPVIEATGIGFSRDGDELRAVCEGASANLAPLSLTAASVQVLVRAGAIQSFEAGSADVSLIAPPAKDESAVLLQASAIPPPPTVAAPVIKSKGGGKALKVVAPLEAAKVDNTPLLPLPDLHALRAQVAEFGAKLGKRLPAEGGVKVRAFSWM